MFQEKALEEIKNIVMIIFAIFRQIGFVTIVVIISMEYAKIVDLEPNSNPAPQFRLMPNWARSSPASEGSSPDRTSCCRN